MQKTQTSSSSFMMKNDNSYPAIWRRIPLKVSSALRLYLFNQLSQWCVLCKIPVRIALFTQDIFQNLQNNYYREFLDLFSFLSLLPNTWQNKPRRSFCHCLKGSSQQWWDGIAARSSYGWEWVTYISTDEGQKVGQVVSLKPCSLLAHLFQLGPSSQRCPLKHHQLNEVFKRVCLREMFHTQMATLPVLAHQFVGESLSKVYNRRDGNV